MEQQAQPDFFEKDDPTASAQVGALLPPSQTPTAEFDYSGVDADVVEHARDTAAFVRSIEPAIGAMVCEAGSRLCEVKKQLGHGRFGKWLASHGINPRTAQNYMNVATAFGVGDKYETVSHFPQRLLYRVSSCPLEFREGLIEQIRDGAEPSDIEHALRLAKMRALEQLTDKELDSAAYRASRNRQIAKVRREEHRIAGQKAAAEELSAMIVRLAGNELPVVMRLLRATGSITAPDLKRAAKKKGSLQV